MGLEHHGAGVWLGAEVQALQEALWGMYGKDSDAEKQWWHKRHWEYGLRNSKAVKNWRNIVSSLQLHADKYPQLREHLRVLHLQIGLG